MRDSRGRTLPDFFIAGAQKAGTATLSEALAARPDAFLCDPREPMFLCRDDASVHPHGFVNHPELWRGFDWQRDRESLLDAYAGLFREAGKRIVGEGSTSYLHAERVPERIAGINPAAKIVIVMRDPVARAWSAYWHHVKNMRIAHSFEDTLRYEAGDLLEIGRYAHHVRRWLDHFPREHVLLLVFEEVVGDFGPQYGRVCALLDLPPGNVREAPRANEAMVPGSIGVQRLVARGLRAVGADLEASVLRGSDSRGLGLRLADRALRTVGKVNRRLGSRYPHMRHDTHELLCDYFARENEGIAELIGHVPAWDSLRSATTGEPRMASSAR
jgi:hypothetical protein